MNKARKATGRVLRHAMGTVAVLALVSGTAMVAPQGDGGWGFNGQSAVAAPGGNGNGNGGNSGNAGNSGNRGNSGNAGNSGNSGNAANSASADGKGNALGRSVSHGETAHASELGRLNAAHASETARANAAPNSAVGAIASYERDVLAGDLEGAAASFVDAANKDIVEPVVHAVNQLLGIDDAPVARDEDTATDDANEGDADEGDVGGLTVHDTEAEIVARANGTFDPPENGDTAAPDNGRDS